MTGSAMTARSTLAVNAKAIAVALLLACPSVQASDHQLSLQEIFQQALYGDHQTALKLINQRIAKSDEILRHHFIKALILNEANQTDEAIVILEELARSYPKQQAILNNLAVLYIKVNRLNDAEATLQKAISLNPNYAVAHENLGDLYVKMANAAFKQAIVRSKQATPAQQKSQLINDRLQQLVTSSEENSQQDNDKAAIKLTIKRWSQVWAAQRVDQYLNFYADDFEPSRNISLSEWRHVRRERISSPSFIKLSVSAINFDILNNESALITFQQHYTSDRFSDQSTKRLRLIKTQHRWLIQKEQSY